MKFDHILYASMALIVAALGVGFYYVSKMKTNKQPLIENKSFESFEKLPKITIPLDSVGAQAPKSHILTESEMSIVLSNAKDFQEYKQALESKSLTEGLILTEELPKDLAVDYFKKLAKKIKAKKYDKYFSEMNIPEKLGHTSQYLKQNVMRYDRKRQTTGQLVSEIIRSGRGACASMPIMYAVVCEHLDIPIKLVTVGDHIFARYEQGTTWINIEATVENKTGVGTPDQAYKDGIAAESKIFQDAVEKGYDMRNMTLQEMIGQMYSNKTSHLLQKNGLRRGTLDKVWKSACIGLALNPNDWMLALNWRNIHKEMILREDEFQLTAVNAQIAEIEPRSNTFGVSNPHNFGKSSIINNLPSNSVFEAENLKYKIMKAERGLGVHVSSEELTRMKTRLKKLQDPTSRHMLNDEQDKLRRLKQMRNHYQSKIDEANRKSNTLKVIYNNRRSK